MRQIVLDTETTGLLTSAGHKLIEIGCLELYNRRFTGISFHHYLNPQRPVDKDAFAIHGLSDEFLKDKPTFATIFADFLAFIAESELIIHNAPFDLGFLNYELQLINKEIKRVDQRCPVIDTLVLARNKHPGQSNSLDALCRRYQIDNSKRHLHGALMDAHLLGQVYLAMTGGQDQLFGAEEFQNLSSVTQQLDYAGKSKSHIPLPIVLPSMEEQKAHEKFLDLLKKQGKCVWSDLNGTYLTPSQ